MLELTHCELAGLNDATRIDVLNVTGNCTVYVGDCVESLRTMPDKSVHCCVTSPPYWGLRDYGTARWEGGSADCDHKNRPLASPKSTLKGHTPDVKLAMGGMPLRDTCGKCGAIRVDNQLGLEKTPEEYVAKMVEVFREVRRVLKDDGTLWLNLGDSYANPPSGQAQRAFNGQGGDYGRGGFPKSEAHVGKLRHSIPSGLKPKDLVGIPWRVAFALQADGWYLRQDIIWAKPNPMPESVTDRCTKSHEYIFLMSKSAKYWYDADAVKEAGTGRNWMASGGNLVGKGVHKCGDGYRDNKDGRSGFATGRNRRSVWHISTRPYKGAHFATFPPALIEPCIKAGCPAGGTVLDPFGGSGTTGRVANDLGRKAILCELNTSYVELIKQRLTEPAKPLKKRTRDRLARGVEGADQK